MHMAHMAGSFAKAAGYLQERPQSENEFYAGYRRPSIRAFIPFVSAAGTIGAWLFLIGLVPA